MTNQKKKNPGGRPSEYTKEKGELICELIATNPMGLREICKQNKEIPYDRTIYRWLYRFEEFRQHYARAKMFQADLLAEECLLISDLCAPDYVNVARLRVDTRKWLASKLLPKQYGEHRLLEEKTEENERLKEELLELRGKLDARNKKEF